MISAAATVAAPGKDENQDSVSAFSVGDTQASGGAGVIVCDGVGSQPNSGKVAREVVALATAHVAETGVVDGISQLDMVCAEGEFGEDGATTLLAVGAEVSGVAAYCYIGNGGLFEVVPQSDSGSTARLRWCDLALPQIEWESGRPALRSFLPAPEEGYEAEKGTRAVGLLRPRLLIACSDGISTDEERAQATSATGEYWKAVPSTLVRLLDGLASRWFELVRAEREAAGQMLHDLIQRTLEGLLDENMLDDDASIGCVMARPQVQGA